MLTRREFLDTLAVGGVGLAINSTAKSYGQILGANDRLNFAIIGLHSRAYAHLSALKANKDTARVAYVCDVDMNTMKKFAADTERELGYAPATDQDFRHILQKKDVDAITIATRITGTRRCRFSGSRLGSTSMSKSPAATTPPKARCLSKRSRNMES